MPTAPLVIDDLLDPIPTEPPCGKDLRLTAEWDRIKEARRADDGLETGKWTRRESKTANWRQVEELTTAILRTQSKDLQIAMWLTEANLKLRGFAGLADGLRLVRELIERYWDQGLFPAIEDGPEDRVGPFAWLNDKLADSIAALPITRGTDPDTDYSYIDLQDARQVGSEAGYKIDDDEIDEHKKKAYDTAVANGHISMDMFQRAVKETDFAAFANLQAEFERAYGEFKALEKLIDTRFGDAAPNLSACRTILKELQQEIGSLVDKRRKELPVPPAEETSGTAENPGRAETRTLRFPLGGLSSGVSASPLAGSWQEAERLVRAGQVDAGLAEMTRLAAAETSGRNRFQRKLLLAEICLASKRERLALAILEELAEQIDKFQLEVWETSELVCSVWTRLYALYKRGEQPDADRARKLYDRLCRLDPWQALACGE